ncbi:MAG: indole-3-glycerol phosphate synthase TrpC [Dysgonamonadaceae bacterium]|jgi:indole-3-glycerol phosphate synthase|nr:indole-3-glycerol phosphate synthase TrpC [Dysgonamonadaceae bacterium]
MDILNKIIAQKRIELSQYMQVVSLDQLRTMFLNCRTAQHSLKNALSQSATPVIAEFKRKSPSKGFINESADVKDIIPGYARSGAAGISVLTDRQFFGGNIGDLKLARTLTDLPLLRKDFIIDEYQLYVAKAIGADVILLIAAALTVEQTLRLARKAKTLNLEVLLELHDEKELGHINEYVDIVGINNRNLKTFSVDIDASIRLADRLPADLMRISESGISQPETIVHLMDAGFRGFLIGECFMKAPDPEAELNDFILRVEELRKTNNRI